MKEIIKGGFSAETLDNVRNFMDEVNSTNLMKILFRRLFTNMSEDELHSDKCSIASVTLLSELFEKVQITNAVELEINGDVIFKDHNNKDDDLEDMLNAAQNAKIDHLDSAKIVMEEDRSFDSSKTVNIKYTVDIMKNADSSVDFEIIVETNDDVCQSDFNGNLEVFVDALKLKSVTLSK